MQEFKGIEAAHGIAPVAGRLAHLCQQRGRATLDVFDRESGKLVKKVPLSDRPNNIAVTKNGDRVLVGIARGPGAVDVIDAKTLTRTKSIPVKGRLHNIYVTPDGKHLITGSIPAKLMTVIDLEREVPVWELAVRSRRAADDHRGQPRRRDQAHLRAALRHQRLCGGGFCGRARRSRGSRCRRPQTEFETDAGRAASPSHGIGVSPDNKTLWVTSIPNNAVFVYSLADLKLIGEVALPSLKLPGRGPIAAVPNWVTFTPDSKTIYISNAALRSVTAIDTAAMKVKAVIPGGRGAQAHQHAGDDGLDLHGGGIDRRHRLDGGVRDVDRLAVGHKEEHHRVRHRGEWGRLGWAA